MALFEGSGVALVTPFHKDKRSVNYETLEKLLHFHLESKTDAIIVCGTTGEASTLTDWERILITQFAVRAVNKRVPVIAGVGSNDTVHAAELSAGCREAGADGLLCVTPYYNKTTRRGLVSHYAKVADAARIPVVAYNVPSRTGLNIAPETLGELAKIEHIAGLKDAAGDIAQTAQYFRFVPKEFDIYSGNDECVVPILALGGKGVISTIANILPRETHDMVHAFLRGNTGLAAGIQIKHLGLIDALFKETNPIPVKTALRLMGYDVGSFREPLCEMEPDNFELLKKEMVKAGIWLEELPPDS